jgi:hypothetical protein
VTKVLSIAIPIALPFQKVCENCHVVNVTISPTCGVYYNVCSKSIVQKLSFLHGSITTNDEFVLLIIKCKWLETIVHMTKSEFLDLPCPKQVQLFISICIHDKFHLLTTFALVGFQENIQEFIPQVETSLKGETFIATSTIIPNDNVQWNLKHKLDFVESKSISKQKPS